MAQVANVNTFHQDATYWPKPVQNGFGGYTFDPPEPIKVRWEQRIEKFYNLQGEEQVSKAIVFVPKAVDIGGYLLLGTSIATDPTTVPGALYISGIRRDPDLRGLYESIRAYL